MRLIDADALKLKLYHEWVRDKDKIDELVDSIPTISEWIPVSEKLPENNGCMLVTINDDIEFGKYEDGEWTIWVFEHWDEWDAKGVTAWMPLPEPYRGGDTE